MTLEKSRLRVGIGTTLGAHIIWGFFPLYLRPLRNIPPLEFVAHRIVWLLCFVLVALAIRRASLADRFWSKRVLLRFLPMHRFIGIDARKDRQEPIRPLANLGISMPSPSRARRNSRRSRGLGVLGALLLGCNWLVYVWAVSKGRVVDASLGYFINPLLTVALGALVLKERLSRQRWFAVALALLGVLWLTLQLGQIPWIGLVLATSFGTYGLLRKVAPLGSLDGLLLEALFLFPVAAVYLSWLAWDGRSGFLSAGAGTKVLLMLSGPMTAIPLLLFAAGARRIPLSLSGVIQYVGPTMQLMIGILVWNESFGVSKLVGYAFIWAGFGLYILESLRSSRAGRRAIREEPAATIP